MRAKKQFNAAFERASLDQTGVVRGGRPAHAQQEYAVDPVGEEEGEEEDLSRMLQKNSGERRGGAYDVEEGHGGRVEHAGVTAQDVTKQQWGKARKSVTKQQWGNVHGAEQHAVARRHLELCALQLPIQDDLRGGVAGRPSFLNDLQRPHDDERNEGLGGVGDHGNHVVAADVNVPASGRGRVTGGVWLRIAFVSGP